MGGDVPKQYRSLAGKPVLRWAVEPFLAHHRVDAVRVVLLAGAGGVEEVGVGGLGGVGRELLDARPGWVVGVADGYVGQA